MRDMRECEQCKNMIPDKMRICPHCGKLPPTLWPQFYLYVVLTLIAFGCAVYFRPFLNGPVIGQTATGVLWVAEVVFLIFGIIFLNVSIIVMKDYRNRSFKDKLTKPERERFIKMKQRKVLLSKFTLTATQRLPIFSLISFRVLMVFA